MKLTITGWAEGAPIPPKFAFGRIPPEGRFEVSDNINPQVAWDGAPAETQSFALICHDPDVPHVGDDVNQEGKTVPADLARVDFFHWVVVDIPADRREIAEGEASNGVTPGGKPAGARAYGRVGANSYTQWFAGDAQMGGVYNDYDGPCPPWNDARIHRYIFTIYALDTPKLDLGERFDGVDARMEIEEHALASAIYSGTYSMNRDL